MSDIQIFCDRGGTFTDFVAQYTDKDGIVHHKTKKLLSVNPSHYRDAAIEGIRRLMEEITGDSYPKEQKLDTSRIKSIRMGTTVATNALLERKGEDVVFVTTEGLEDILRIGNQSRPNLFALDIHLPELIYKTVIAAKERVIVVPNADTYNDLERTTAIFPHSTVVTGNTGESVIIIKPLDVDDIRQKLQEQYDHGLRSIAIALPHSYTFNDHEIQIANIAKEIGFTQVSTSHQTSAVVKLLSRGYTTCVDAYLAPVLSHYIKQFIDGFDEQLFDNTEVLFMQSDGGLTDYHSFTGFKSILSGPAGGFCGFSKTSVVRDPSIQQVVSGDQQYIDLAKTITSPKVLDTIPSLSALLGVNTPSIGFDVGGTSCDVSLSSSGPDGEPDYVFENTIAGVVICAPALDINTVASGGGSILRFDNGIYHCGPQSAGSYPGPACYHMVPDAPLTVTDANCITGKIDPNHFPHVFGPNQNEPLSRTMAYEKFVEMTREINAWRKQQFDSRIASLSASGDLDNNGIDGGDTNGEDGYHDLTPEEVALGFLTVSYEAICRPIRSLTESKGLDIRAFTLAAFGGAAGQSACMIANNLDINVIHFSNMSSVLSAYGIGIAPITAEKHRTSNTYLQSKECCDHLASFIDELTNICLEELSAHNLQQENTTKNVYSLLKFKGTDTTLMVPIDDTVYTLARDGKVEQVHSHLAAIFKERYQQEFGFLLEREIILDSIRVRVEGFNNMSTYAGLPTTQTIPEPREIVKCYMFNLKPKGDESSAQGHGDGKNESAPGKKPSSTAATDAAVGGVGAGAGSISEEKLGAWHDVPLYDHYEFSAGTVLPGPAIIVDTNTTIVVEFGWSAFILSDSIVLLKGDRKEQQRGGSEKPTQQQSQTLVAPPPGGSSLQPTIDASGDVIEINNHSDAVKYVPCQPVMLSIFSHRFMSIAEQMGRVLQRTAISVNIKDRLDFSCALFSSDGSLISNAPAIPIHLGAMCECIRSLIRTVDEWVPGDVFATNSPVMGGTHLPDITVISTVFKSPFTPGDRPIFFVASRGHHSDIGGISPGSMPPFSTTIYEEGVEILIFKLLKGGLFDLDGITKLLTSQTNPDDPRCRGTRNISDNISDLQAQVAANTRGVHLMHTLIKSLSLPVVLAYMYHIQDAAQSATRDLLRAAIKPFSTNTLPTVIDYMDDGTPIVLTISIDRETGDAVFDFTGTGTQVLGNINTPPAIVSSTIIYALRALIDKPLPLNQGVLLPVTIKVPEQSLLSPDSRCAVVGGNVLTSQRITDIILTAFGAIANSQGCMNNFTFGSNRPNGSYGMYETIAGGSGAGTTFHGTTCHTHMTNTMITDAEIIERRFPVILNQFKIRPNSGGLGQYRGGNGVIREMRFLDNVDVNILSERRSLPPNGLAGGRPGARGVNYKVEYLSPTTHDFSSSAVRLISLGGKNSFVARSDGSTGIRILTPGGGGYGRVEDDGSQSTHTPPPSAAIVSTAAATTTHTVASSIVSDHTQIGSVARYFADQEK